jgi:hypothetical protein
VFATKKYYLQKIQISATNHESYVGTSDELIINGFLIPLFPTDFLARRIISDLMQKLSFFIVQLGSGFWIIFMPVNMSTQKNIYPLNLLPHVIPWVRSGQVRSEVLE